jgi:hypothetical protein
MNSIEEPKSIYILLILILIKYEIIMFAAGPAEMKNIKSFCFASWDNDESKEILYLSQFSIKWSGTGKNL